MLIDCWLFCWRAWYVKSKQGKRASERTAAAVPHEGGNDNRLQIRQFELTTVSPGVMSDWSALLCSVYFETFVAKNVQFIVHCRASDVNYYDITYAINLLESQTVQARSCKQRSANPPFLRTVRSTNSLTCMALPVAEIGETVTRLSGKKTHGWQQHILIPNIWQT